MRDCQWGGGRVKRKRFNLSMSLFLLAAIKLINFLQVFETHSGERSPKQQAVHLPQQPMARSRQGRWPS